MSEPDVENIETFHLDIPYEPKAFHFFEETWVFRVVNKLYSYHLETYELFLDRNVSSDHPLGVHVQVYLLSTSNEDIESLIGEGSHLFQENKDSNMIAVYGKMETSDNDRLKIVMKKVPSEQICEDWTVTSAQPRITGKLTASILDARWIDDFDSECLSTDLTNLFACQHLSDIDLDVGDQTIPAHKCILTARSETLKQELSKDTSSLKIEDSNFDAVNIFVSYIYSGKLPALDIEQARDLYRLAHKFKVNSLTKTLSVVLAANFSEENVLDTLRLADDYSDQKLKVRAIEYVIEYHVILSQQWKEFSKTSSKLSREVCKAFIEKSNDDSLKSEDEDKQNGDEAQSEKKAKKRIWKLIFK